MDLARPLHLSNEAVKLLWAGNDVPGQPGEKDGVDRYFDAAVIIFSNSLQEIKHLLSYPKDHLKKSMNDDGLIPGDQSSTSPLLSTVSWHGGTSSSPTILGSDCSVQKSISLSFQTCLGLCDRSDNSCYFYNKAILFHFGNGNDGTCSSELNPSFLTREDFLHIYSSFIILNIALAYHQKALSLPIGEQQNTMLGQAEHLYETVAQKMHSTLSIINDGVSNDLGNTAILVHAAAINNLSLLQYRRCGYTESHKGFEYLELLIFHTVVDPTGLSFLKGTPLNQDYEDIYRHMLLNIYFLHPPALAAAA